jgi:hypothetical protein
LIFVLARAARGAENGLLFEEFERDFRPWLRAMTDAKTVDPRLPFWHLQSDGPEWRLEPAGGYVMQSGRNRPTANSLKAMRARGYLADPLWSEAFRHPDRAQDLARALAERWIPDADRRATAMRLFEETARC